MSNFSNDLQARMIKAFVKEPDGEVSLVNIPYLHQKTHKGDMFFVSHLFNDVSNGATVYIRHVSGPNKELHSELTANTTGQWLFQSYASTTFSADGTELDKINRRSDSSKTLETTFYHTPTIDVLGTPRLSFLFGGGTNPSRAATGSFNERLESIFGPDVDVLVAFTNQSGTTQDISVLLDVYEETPR